MTDRTLSDHLGLWHRALIGSVRSDAPDLTTRQMAILLSIYTTSPPHTVRGLAAELGVAKPVITRALDTLSVLGYVRRKRDEQDRRSVFVQRTVKGAVFLSEFRDILAQADDASSPR
ncbi:MarR family transcriptional regulator [Iodidimonas gelatinilytica]|uniref:MarR family transcriptional regulator n=1 Tax=Iodidimonas gelatinilytica TaxID=1236966 RepID=A0A5A7MY60_9PROT|nr:MarR family transcriptional regulator [Iodidimonas gelatinilytica]GEQ98671.1 MarR family transcriptional regulator [Iodidimonas gelatinilytica]GER00817.1 MarR family transcriptional regulator [Iodidimonas gelatinilytica]